MDKEEIKTKLKECFRNCASGRKQLRKCVINALDTGLTKDEVLAVTDELVKKLGQDEISFCAIVATGQVLKYQKKDIGAKFKSLGSNKKEEVKNILKVCFKKCALARRKLRKCIVNSLDAGLTKNEILLITDDIVGGVGKDEVSLCGIIAVDQILKYEEDIRAEPINVVEERRTERGDA